MNDDEDVNEHKPVVGECMPNVVMLLSSLSKIVRVGTYIFFQTNY